MVMGIMGVGCGWRGRNLNGTVRKGSLGRAHLSKDQENVRDSLREDTRGRQKSNCKEEPGTGTWPTCLRNSKAASTAGAECQGLQQSLAGHREGRLWPLWVQWMEVTGGLWSRVKWPDTLEQTCSDSYPERLAGGREWEEDWTWGFLSRTPKHL